MGEGWGGLSGRKEKAKKTRLKEKERNNNYIEKKRYILSLN